MASSGKATRSAPAASAASMPARTRPTLPARSPTVTLIWAAATRRRAMNQETTALTGTGPSRGTLAGDVDRHHGAGGGRGHRPGGRAGPGPARADAAPRRPSGAGRPAHLGPALRFGAGGAHRRLPFAVGGGHRRRRAPGAPRRSGRAGGGVPAGAVHGRGPPGGRG